jgi:hypothetical protein
MKQAEAGAGVAASSSSARTRSAASPSMRPVLAWSSARRARTSRSCARTLSEDDGVPKSSINIVEIRKPEIDATLVAENIAQQLERRVAFRRAMKRAVQSAMRLGALKASASIARAVWAARKSRARNGIAKAACRCTRCVPTSITARPRRRPPMAPAASRSGSSRARSWSMIRWRRTSAAEAERRWQSRPSRAREREQAVIRVSRTMLQPKRTKFRKQFKGRIHGAAKGGFSLNSTSAVWPEGDGAGARHRAPDRGGAPRHHPCT